MGVDLKLLPIKGHFFLFNAGTAPLVPYLSTYARQLGFSSATVGLIYTVLPIFGLVAKPLFGVIADRFKIQKSLFLLFQLVIILSFSAIYLIPENRAPVSIELDCGAGVTVIRSRVNNTETHIDQCKVKSLANTKELAACDMNCDMTSPKMWQTICEHWHIPHFCYSNIRSIRYKVHTTSVNVKNGCVYIPTSNVTLDDLAFTPRCRIGRGFVDINVPCLLNCSNVRIHDTIKARLANMTCIDEMLNYELCVPEVNEWIKLTNGNESSECLAACYLYNGTPWRLMEICEGWEADEAATCQPKSMHGRHFPDNLTFTGYVSTASTIVEHGMVYMQLKHIAVPDGTIHYPNCVSKAQYQVKAELFRSACDIKCNNSVVDELFQMGMDNSEAQYTSQFWMFFAAMIISWIGQAVVVTFADAICFNVLGSNSSQYGKQRLWGSVGWGLLSLVTGALIDVYSDGAYKNYAVAFILMFVFMMGDFIVSCFMRVDTTKMSMNILGDVSKLVSSLPTVIFMLWTIVVGMCTGLLWQFLFWHIEDLSGQTCDGSEHVKTLQGLISAIQSFFGEIPFMFLSGYILRRLGHVHVMSIVLFAFGVRFILYSLLSNPWWVLPIEMLQGITFGMFYPTMTSYANVVSPPGTETTIQGLVGAVFEGIGTSLGSLIGGRLYETHGGANTFLWFGCASLVFCVMHIIMQHLLKSRTALIGLNQGYISVIKYEQPNDMVHILEDMATTSDDK